jgi:hypothetical protein
MNTMHWPVAAERMCWQIAVGGLLYGGACDQTIAVLTEPAADVVLPASIDCNTTADSCAPSQMTDMCVRFTVAVQLMNQHSLRSPVLNSPTVWGCHQNAPTVLPLPPTPAAPSTTRFCPCPWPPAAPSTLKPHVTKKLVLPDTNAVRVSCYNTERHPSTVREQLLLQLPPATQAPLPLQPNTQARSQTRHCRPKPTSSRQSHCCESCASARQRNCCC